MIWSKGDAAAPGGPPRAARAPAEYAPAALPERQPALATYLPTGLGGFAAGAAAIVLVLAAVLTVGLYEPTFAAVERAAGQRFGRTVASLEACFDPRATLSLASWLSHVALLGGSAVALAVRSMRRHRRDDFNGRYRAWGWLAGLLVAASFATQVPVGRVVGACVSEASGIAFGPAGFGWWVALSGSLVVGVSLWAVLPLHERLATAVWLAAGLVAWGGCAAAMWLGATRPVPQGLAPAAWTAGCGLVAIAMLAAARSVIREVKGLAAQPARKGRAAQATPVRTEAGGDAEPREEEQDAAAWSAEEAATDYTDGSDGDEEREPRHLSKAERKRLKKLARMGRAA